MRIGVYVTGWTGFSTGTQTPNNGVELTGADVSVFDWSWFMLFISWLSAPAAHPER